MAESATLTIRIDGALKEKLETAAAAQDRTVTEFVTRSIRARIDRVCATCGRSDEPVVVSPGQSDAFREFCADYRRELKSIPITLMLVEAGKRRALHGRLDNMANTSGSVVLRLPFEGAISEFAVAVPLGAIIGWEYDQDRRWYAGLVGRGYADGNGEIRLALMMQYASR